MLGRHRWQHPVLSIFLLSGMILLFAVISWVLGGVEGAVTATDRGVVSLIFGDRLSARLFLYAIVSRPIDAYAARVLRELIVELARQA